MTKFRFEFGDAFIDIDFDSAVDADTAARHFAQLVSIHGPRKAIDVMGKNLLAIVPDVAGRSVEFIK